MAEKNSRRQIDRFFMNNCKIANELRKYRDLAGCLNQVSLSGERVRIPSDSADYAEYFISENLTYLDMVTANAVYTLMVTRPNRPRSRPTSSVRSWRATWGGGFPRGCGRI